MFSLCHLDEQPIYALVVCTVAFPGASPMSTFPGEDTAGMEEMEELPGTVDRKLLFLWH